MKITLLNNLSQKNGMGRYAFSLFDQIKNKVDVDHIYFDYSSGSLRNLNKNTHISQPSLLKIFKNKLLIIKYLEKFIPKYELYHLTNQNLSFLNVRSKIVTCHDIVPLIYPSNRFEFLIRRYIYSGLKNADKIIADSISTKNDLINHFSIPKEKIRVIPLGVDTKIFRRLENVKKPDKPIILHVGSEARTKNVETLVKALAKVNSKIKFQFVRIGNKSKTLTGETSYSPQIYKLLIDNNIDFSYKFNLAEEELVNWYNKATLFVFPSAHEGFGLPPLEAMACGCPVITSDTSSLPEITGDAAILVNPYDIEGIAKAIERVLNSQNLREDMIGKGLRQAKTLSWENTANQTLKVYKEVLGEI